MTGDMVPELSVEIYLLPVEVQVAVLFCSVGALRNPLIWGVIAV